MGYIIAKIKDNIRKYGMIKFFKRAFIKVSNIILTRLNNILFSKKYNRQLDDILSKNIDKKIVVLYPFFDFNMPNFQRFQQVAIALGSRDDVLFFYATPNNIYDSVFGFEKKIDNLYITNQYKMLLGRKNIKLNIIFVSTDLRFSLKDVQDALKRGDNVIYDYVDEIHEDIVGNISKDIILRHETILKDENIRVIVTADKLEEEVKKYRTKNYENISNGVKLEDFIIDDKEKETFYNNNKKINEVKSFCNKYKVNVMYYGVFAKWFDYDLISNVAKDKNIGIILIGPDYDLSLKKSDILEYTNIMYLGLIEYKKLKYFADLADILTIPFVVNDITNATSPVKLFEYMAMRKPIITTDLLECKKYKSVTIAKDSNDFIDKCYLLKDNIDKEKIYEEAKENSWNKKCEKFLI